MWPVILAAAVFLMMCGLVYVVRTVREVQREEAEIKAEMEVSGVTVRAWIYEAHPAIYQPGSEDRPAQVLVCFDPAAADRPNLLEEVADRMRGVDADAPADGAEAEVARITGKILPHDKKYLVPADFTGGPAVYLTFVYVERAALPAGVLELPFVYGRTLPSERGMVYMDPYPAETARAASFGRFRG